MITEAPLEPLSAAVFAALAAVVLAATIRRPVFAVVALILTAPFAFYHDAGPTLITFGKVALVAAAAGLLVRRPRPSFSILGRGAARAIGLAVLALVIATAISLAVAHDRGAALRETLKAAQYALTFGVAALAWSLDPDRRLLRVALLCTVAAVCILALAQEITGAPSGIWYHGKAFPRIAGPLEGPNQLAGYLGIVLPFLAVFALESPGYAALGACALGSAALVLTLSRAGLAAGAIALAIVFVASGRQLRAPVLRALGALGAGLVAAAGVLVAWHVSDIGGRFVSFSEVERSGGVGTRSILWRAAYDLWRAHPLLGVGAGNYELDLPQVAPAGIKTHANSWYLQSLVEGGIPLLAATLAEIWASIVPLRRALGNGLCLATFAASIGFALHGIFDLMVFFPKVAVTWFVVLGIAAVEAEPAA